MQDLAVFVGAELVDTYVSDCYNTAVALVDNYVGLAEVPQAVLDRCYLVVGAEMWHQRQAPQGVAQFADLQGIGIRIARDPMTPAYPLLQAWVVGF